MKTHYFDIFSLDVLRIFMLDKNNETTSLLVPIVFPQKIKSRNNQITPN